MNILIVLISILGLLVLHEFGHFIVAKLFGVEVEEFGIGLPPRLFGKKFRGTLYSLNLLPFGAFVKIPSMEREYSQDEKEDTEKLKKIPLYQRMLIALAGVVSFWLISFILLTIVFNFGTLQAISDEDDFFLDSQVQVVAIAPNSPAETAGLRAGDFIKELRVGDNIFLVSQAKDVQEFIQENKGEEISLTFKRGKEEREVSLLPRENPPLEEGAIGVALVRVAKKSSPFFLALWQGLKETYFLTLAIITGFAQVFLSLFQGRGLPPGVEFVGIIGLSVFLTEAIQIGFTYYLQFVAMVSVYLAVFNILPIPALDGGKLLFLFIEKIKGRPIDLKTEKNLTLGFFLFFFLLMIFVTVKDIIRLF